MYNNAGKSIKSVTKAVVGVIMFLCVMAGIVVWGTLKSLAGGFLVMGIGCFTAWLMGLCMYAFGEIADRLISIDEKIGVKGNIKENPKKVDQIHEEVCAEWVCASCGTVNDKRKQRCVKCAAAKDWSDEQMNCFVERNADSSWICPFCDNKNSADADWCEKCGYQAKFR